jgi:glucose 1-dehydrogenase
VGKESHVKALFEAAIAEYGPWTFWSPNAGIQKDAPFLEMTADDWREVLDVNLTGAFLCAREAARVFVPAGNRDERSARAGRKNHFVSSVHETIPWAGM